MQTRARRIGQGSKMFSSITNQLDHVPRSSKTPPNPIVLYNPEKIAVRLVQILAFLHISSCYHILFVKCIIAVCTPTRYGLLTGRYGWRTRLKRGVLSGYARPLLAPDRETLGSFLGANGYRTAVIGKWHLGLGFAKAGYPLYSGDPKM